ncbi:response regulator transcription factor [Variovorax sp.]|uniref:response regulator transcription factor n=1 Tax=Variovorax sp. TaxID=1871043 RepID=UPI002D38B807|nr:response regulator transcription factor [Variovorax sp.]HYP83165.1 response regulator transcription factor [Variovorax sp.]
MRIATLDDEVSQIELIRHTMNGIDHECHAYTEGKALMRDLRVQSFDLLILDWTLPDIQGPSIVKWVREDLASRMPILFVTNRRDEADLVEGLAAGADDFMVKPIRAAELQARVRALLRRAYPSQHEVELQFGTYHFFPQSRTLHVDGAPVDLKHREYELALFLFQNMGRLLSREHLREAVWGRGPDEPSRSLDTHISRLRTKLSLRPANGFLLSAVYGLGYRLETVDTGMSPYGADEADAEAGIRST